MKRILSLMLVSILSVTSVCTSMYGVFGQSANGKDTPVAAIPNDTYEPYQYSKVGNETAAIGAVKREMESLGGSVEVYSSEDEYNRAQEKRIADAVRTSAMGYDEEGFQPVRQTITVMTTATGSEENGNYVESQPIVNAIVRIDGVPRYTGRDGKITTTVDKEYIELYVEKNDYSPYIEIMDVTGEEKVVHLKKPSDNIDIYAVMLEYEGEFYNLLTQQCYINKELNTSVCEMIVKSNVPIEQASLLVNGQRELFRLNGTIDDFDFSQYSKEDKFSVKIQYNGIESKEYPLNLIVIDPNPPKLALTEQNENTNVVIGESDTPIGEVAEVNIPQIEIQKYLLELINRKDAAIEIGNAKIKFSYYYNARKGQIERTIGFGISLPLPDKTIDHEQNKIKKLEQEKASYDYQSKQYENEIVKLQNEIDDLQKKNSDRDETVKKYIQTKKDEINDLADRYLNLSGDDNYDSLKKSLNQEKRNLTNNLNYHRKQYKKTKDAIEKLISQQKSLAGTANMIPQPAKKLDKIFKSKTSKFDADLQFEFYGVWTYSAVTGEMLGFKINGNISVKLNYTYSFMVWVIPCFVSVDVTVGLRAQITILDEKTGNRISLAEFWNFFELHFIFGFRLDIGVGVKGLVDMYVSGFGSTDFDFKIKPNTEGDMIWRAGVKAKFLFWEQEWAHRGEPVELYGENEATLLSRSLYSESLSDNANLVSSNLYQNSDVKFADLGNDKYLMVWVEDSAYRDDYNRTVLKYSVYENGQWSTPRAILDDGKADLYSDLYFDGKKAYVTWQKSSKAFSDSDNVSSVLQAGEIYCAEFDSATNEFKNTTQITDNSVMDAAPRFAKKEKASDTLSIIWQRNSENNIFGISGTNSILYSQLSGNDWSRPLELFSAEVSLDGMDAAMKDGELTVAVITDADGDFMTQNGKITVLTKGQTKTIEHDGAVNVQFCLMDEKICLVYYADGYVYRSDDFISSMLWVDIPQNAIPCNYTVTTTAHGAILTYQKLQEEYKQAYCAVLNEDGSWTFDVALTEGTGSVYKSYGLKGNANFATFAYAVEDKDGNASLHFSRKAFSPKIAVEDVYYAGQLINGEESELRVVVKNTGAKDIYSLKISTFGVTKQVDLVDSPLLVGESRLFILPVDVRINGTEEKVVAQVIENEEITATAEFMLNLKLTDISIVTDIKIVNGKQNFIATLQNNSVYETKVALKLYKNGVFTECGEYTLSAGESLDVSFSFKEISAGDYIFFNAETDLSDVQTMDNSAGIFSVQDEKEPLLFTNPYQEALDYARRLLI